MEGDEKLIERYREGDIEAFEKLYLRYRSLLFNFIQSLTHNRDLTEDIFQQTFIRVIDNINSYTPSNFKAYLFTIARNLVIDHTRKKHLMIDKNIEDLNFELKSEQDTENNAIKNIESETIRLAIEELSEEYKEIIYLKHFAGLRFEEISKITNTSLGTLLSRFKRALEKLKTILTNKKLSP
ncbi:MAG: RNA polymerase sigma factor [Elusimicrobiales bacterium]